MYNSGAKEIIRVIMEQYFKAPQLSLFFYFSGDNSSLDHPKERATGILHVVTAQLLVDASESSSSILCCVL